jgi:drug/metabolite transporter (DMT)-like permease
MNKRVLGSFLAIGAAILWGVSGNFAQFLFEHRGVDSAWMVTVRLLLAGLLLLAMARLRDLDVWSVWRTDAVRTLSFAIFGMLGVQYTYFAAIHASNAATATVLQYLGPVFIAIWYAWTDRRVPRPLELLAIASAVAGTVLLVTHGDLSSLAISPEALAWGLLSALTLAYYSVQPVPLLKRHDSSVVVGWGMLAGGLAIALVKPPWHVTGTWDLAAYGSAAFIVVLGSLLPFYAYLSAVKLIGANTASLLACAEPLSAMVVAVIWLNVPLTLADWIGTAFILATIVILTWRERSSSRTS